MDPSFAGPAARLLNYRRSCTLDDVSSCIDLVMCHVSISHISRTIGK